MSEKLEEWKFFVNGEKYGSSKRKILGCEIKWIWGGTTTYQMYYEGKDELDHIYVADSQEIDLSGKPKKFYASPPATY